MGCAPDLRRRHGCGIESANEADDATHVQLNASFSGYHAAGVPGAGTEVGSTIDAESDEESDLDVEVEADADAGGDSGADIDADAKVKVPTSENGWTRSKAELDKVSVIGWLLRLLG